MYRNFLKTFVVLLVGILGMTGCGSSGNDFDYNFNPGGGTTTTVELRSVLAQTVVPNQVVAFRGSGFNAAGNRVYGPQDKAKAELVQWTLVPIEVTEFLVEYLDGNGAVVGTARVNVLLVAGRTFTIDNPTITFVEPELTSLILQSGQTYNFNTDTGIISPAIDGSTTPPGWNAATNDFTLDAFTMQNGSVLNVTGTTAFKVTAESDITLDGTLSFVGADGVDGEELVVSTSNTTPRQGEDGTDGSQGGGVTLTSATQVVGGGTINTSGGNGGNGGNVTINGNNDATISGGNGGDGCSAGLVSVIDSDESIPTTINLIANPGNGGTGGDVTVTGYNDQVNVTTVAGGNGGSGGSRGGNGGNATVLGANSANDTVQGGDGGNATLPSGTAGNGGNAKIGGENYNTFSMEFTDGAAVGGKGGNATAVGGKGGDGGDASVDGSNFGTATGGTGGTGNPSPQNDGTDGSGEVTVPRSF